jgi:hypothetical protein
MQINFYLDGITLFNVVILKDVKNQYLYHLLFTY